MTSYDYLSDFDLLQLIDLAEKGHREGLGYACENWRWDFDDLTIREAFDAASGGNLAALRHVLAATYQRREQWWRNHPHPTQIAPLEAHEAEVERRARDAAR